VLNPTKDFAARHRRDNSLERLEVWGDQMSVEIERLGAKEYGLLIRSEKGVMMVTIKLVGKHLKAIITGTGS